MELKVFGRRLHGMRSIGDDGVVDVFPASQGVVHAAGSSWPLLRVHPVGSLDATVQPGGSRREHRHGPVGTERGRIVVGQIIALLSVVWP